MVVVVNAVSAKMGGAAVYIEQVVAELAAHTADHFIVCLPAERAAALERRPNVTVIVSDAAERSLWRRLWWEQLTLRRILLREDADVLYSSANFGMIWCPRPQLLLMRMPLYFSEPYLTRVLPRHGWKYRLEFRLRQWMACHSARHADALMTPSQALLDAVRGAVPLDGVHTFVNPYGTVLDRFGSAERVPSPDGALRLLHVSHYADHKNLAVVFRALRLLRLSGFSVRLVTTANVDDDRYPDSVQRHTDAALLRDPVVRDCVTVLGDVPYRDVPALYASADVFVFPSMTESFGHPMIEAMASGLPTIAADTAINREILGGAAVYFAPDDADELSLCIRRVATDVALSSALRARALARATRYRWSDHVQRLRGWLERLCDRPPATVAAAKARP